MPVAFIVTVPPQDGLAEAYDAAMADMGLTDHLPPGARFHSAGAWEGGWRAVDIWDSDEAFDDFVRTTLGPALGRHAIGQPTIERIPVRRLLEGAGTPVVTGIARLGLGAEEADALVEDLYPGGRLPEGIVVHANGPAAGGWVAITVWSSREKRAAFIEERVRPAMPERTSVSFEEIELHNSLTKHPAMT